MTQEKVLGATGYGVYLDFSSAIMRYGAEKANVLGIKNPSEHKVRELGEGVIDE